MYHGFGRLGRRWGRIKLIKSTSALSVFYVFPEVDGLLAVLFMKVLCLEGWDRVYVVSGKLLKQKFRLAFSCTPFIMSATSWKNRKNAETIQSDLQGLALLYRMAGHLEAARQVLETFFTRTANIKGLKGSSIYQEAKNLYRELSTALGVQKQGH